MRRSATSCLASGRVSAGLVGAILGIGFLGCRIHPGANHLLFVTRTNSGFDADTIPPVIEISLASRFEGVLAPTFERSQTIPVVASFRGAGLKGANGLPSLGTLFAAGPAAMAATDANTGDPSEYERSSEIQLTQPPRFDTKSKRLFGSGEAPPMWFGTATSFGLELEFWGPGVFPAPQSVHLGYRRKEMLVAPLTLEKPQGDGQPYIVRTPSVFVFVNAEGAPSDVPSKVESVCQATNRRAQRDTISVQFFATGLAATRIAARPDVRHLIFRDFIQQYERSLATLKALELKKLELKRALNSAAVAPNGS